MGSLGLLCRGTNGFSCDREIMSYGLASLSVRHVLGADVQNLALILYHTPRMVVFRSWVRLNATEYRLG